MIDLNSYRRQYAFDKGQNLIQRFNSNTSIAQRLIPAQQGNQAISQTLYQSISLSPLQKSDLSQTFIHEKIFDKHGNQLMAKPNPGSPEMKMSWDYRNMLQITKNQQTNGTFINEYNIYFKSGQRNRKVTSEQDESGKTTKITESLYLGYLEYRTIWQGPNLEYNGEVVVNPDTGEILSPYTSHSSLRIQQGHRQIATKKVYAYRDGNSVSTDNRETSFVLSDNIDSCSLVVDEQGKTRSYESFYPYGDAAVSYGLVHQQPYKYSGEERDDSGLYYYGYRSLLSANFRWISPDPSGSQGSGLNWYAMVGGNPVTSRDVMGLVLDDYLLLRPGIVTGYIREVTHNSGHVPTDAPSIIQDYLNMASMEEEIDANTYQLMTASLKVFKKIRKIFPDGPVNQIYYKNKLTRSEQLYRMILRMKNSELELSKELDSVFGELHLNKNSQASEYYYLTTKGIGSCDEYAMSTISELANLNMKNFDVSRYVMHRIKISPLSTVGNLENSHVFILIGSASQKINNKEELSINAKAANQAVVLDFWVMDPQVVLYKNYRIKSVRTGKKSYSYFSTKKNNNLAKVSLFVGSPSAGGFRNLTYETHSLNSFTIDRNKSQNKIAKIIDKKFGINKYKDLIKSAPIDTSNSFDVWDASDRKNYYYKGVKTGNKYYIPRISYTESKE